MKFKVKIFTCDKGFDYDLNPALRTIELAKGAEIESVDVSYIDPKELKPEVKNGRFTYDWFQLQFTEDPYNLICFHFPTRYKKKWGITKRGSYQNDPDQYLEFWISCDKQKDFDELFPHEVGHGFLRWNKQFPSDTVHRYAGRLRDLFGIIDLTNLSSMILYRPVASSRITQEFGENKACAKVYPNGVPYQPAQITSKRDGLCPVGYKDFYKLLGMKGHTGMDIATWHGEPVYFNADFDGWMKTETDADGGIGVDVVSNKPVLNGKHVKVRFWHLKRVMGHDGLQVKTGDVIGLADNTGASSGDHLHWAPKWCDAQGNALNRDNGYRGAFDPRPYFVDEFVLTALKKKPQPLTPVQELTRQLHHLQELVRKLIK